MDARIFREPGVGLHRVLVQNWWAVLIRGLVAIAFGGLALVVPGAVMLTLALLFAAYLIVDGAFALIAATRAAGHHERWGLLTVEGALGLVLGVAIFFFPVGAIVLFVFATAVWGLITGALLLGAAFSLHPAYSRWWLAAGGAVSITWSLLLVAVPFVAALVLTWWFAGYAIAFGALMVAASLHLRHESSAPAPFATAAAR